MTTANSIPILRADDPRFAEHFIKASREIGFVAVTGHGIATSLFSEMRNMLVRLFDVDESVKQEGAITRTNYRGFIPLGFFTPNRLEVNGQQPDLYEGYKLHWECPDGDPESPLYGPNRWVAHVPDMAEIVGRYWEACDAFADSLLAVCAAELGVPASEFRAWHERPLTNMTLLHYPAQPAMGDATGIHPHKDTNVLTFLHPDPVGGLEVQTKAGEWIEVEAPIDALVVNIGEMLELWSGGEFVATPHRVLNRSAQERYSFPYFIVPNHAIVVEPLVSCRQGYVHHRMPVGALSAEVWRTNWADERPSGQKFDLGSLRS